VISGILRFAGKQVFREKGNSRKKDGAFSARDYLCEHARESFNRESKRGWKREERYNHGASTPKDESKVKRHRGRSPKHGVNRLSISKKEGE